MKVRYERHFTTGIRDGGSRKYWLTFYTQPTWRRLIARVYHTYDMNPLVHWVAHRVTCDYGTLSGNGWKRNEAGELVEFHGDPTPFRMPHCACQDERCDTLQRKGRVNLATIEVSEVDYNAIKAGYVA